MRLSLGGTYARLRFSNVHGYSPLAFDAVTIGKAADAFSPALASDPAPVQFGGKSGVVIQPGEMITSDPVEINADDLSHVLISLFAEDPLEIHSHGWANRFSWTTLSAVGDRVSDTGASDFRPWTMGWSWLDAIDVLSERPIGAVVALGDSITDGAGSEFDSDTRWTDRLAERLLQLPGSDSRRRSVVNAGIGGNTVAGYGDRNVGVNLLARLDRDALSLSGVREIIVAGGSNDLYLGSPASALIPQLELLGRRIRARGLRPVICTIVPRMGGYGWRAEHEIERQIVNQWVRSHPNQFDEFLDFDRVLDDPARPGNLLASYDADGTHPNSAGYRALGDSIDIDSLVGGK